MDNGFWFSGSHHRIRSVFNSVPSDLIQYIFICWFRSLLSDSVNRVNRTVDDKFCFTLGNILVLFLAFASLRRADSVAVECSPLLICSYFTNLWPVHLNNHEMIHQLVSFTFHNFHSLLSPLSHGSLHALAANSNGRPAFKRGKMVPAFVISSLCYFHLIMGL